MTSSEYRKLSMLLSNIKNGSRDAFSGIYLMYEKKVYFLFCKILKSKSLAKQMTIEFFDYVYLKSATFGNAAVFEKWLYKSLFAKCRRYLIDNQPEFFGDYIDTDSPNGDAIDELLTRDADEMVRYPDGIDVSVDMMQTVDSILSELPLKLRVMVLLHYFCGFEFAEMASAEQISLMAAKNRMLKAHIRLETEEHKYSEIGYDCDGIVVFMPDILTIMADSIVIPADIASGITSRTGVNCLDKTERVVTNTDNSLDNTSYINIPERKRSGNYVTTSYASVEQPQRRSVAQEMSPTVKVLMAIVALLIIIGGTVAVVLAIQGNNQEQPGGSIANIDNTSQQTTIEITTKETTTAPTTETTTETTTAETTTEVTTAETTTEPTTEAATQPTTAAETTTEYIQTPEPDGGNIIDGIEDIFSF